MRRAPAIAFLALLLAATPAGAAPRGTWLAGDLHVHTCYSHDVWCGPGDDNTGIEDFYTYGHTVADDFLLASLRGLDYLAITDHNDIRSQSDPGFGAHGVLPIHAYENSLHGHAQMLGARRIYDNGDTSVAAVTALEDALHADGGVFQANHPMDPRWEYGYDVPVDDVEVWNLPRYYQPPFPAGSDNDGAIRYWQGWLDRGAHVTATGGSDSHWRSTDSAQGPGQPTTWVFSRDRSEAGILDGLRHGRTTISWEPPAFGGARVFLEGDPGRKGRWSAMAGDTVERGAPLRVRVTGAPGSFVEVIADHGAVAFGPVPVTSPSFQRRVTLPRGVHWAYAEVYGEDAREQRQGVCDGSVGDQTSYCRDRVAALAMTSAMYFR